MKKIKLLLIVAALFTTDRITKHIFLLYPIAYAGKVFHFQLFKNPNLFYLPINQKVLASISFLILAFLLWQFIKSLKNKSILVSFSLLLLIFGGVSNLFDRIVFGYIIDWVNLLIFPSFFNLADIMITTGLLSLAIHLSKKQTR